LGILLDLLAFVVQSPADFRTLSVIIGADKIMNPQHFGSDLADVRRRIRINPEIWI